MFILDSLFLSGFRWVLNTVASAAEAELNDDTALREELLAMEMQREMGEISNEEFAEREADLLARIREIKERREGGSGPIAFGRGEGDSSSYGEFAVEATVSGDFHELPHERVAFEAEPLTAGDDSGTIIQGTLVGPTEDVTPRSRGARRKRARPKGTSQTLPAAGREGTSRARGGQRTARIKDTRRSRPSRASGRSRTKIR